MEKLKAKIRDAPLSKYSELCSEIESMIKELELMRQYIDHMQAFQSWLISEVRTGTDLDNNDSLKKMITIINIVPVSTLDVIANMFSNVVLEDQDETTQDIFNDIASQQATVLTLLHDTWKEFHGEK